MRYSEVNNSIIENSCGWKTEKVLWTKNLELELSTNPTQLYTQQPAARLSTGPELYHLTLLRITTLHKRSLLMHLRKCILSQSFQYGAENGKLKNGLCFAKTIFKVLDRHIICVSVVDSGWSSKLLAKNIELCSSHHLMHSLERFRKYYIQYDRDHEEEVWRGYLW